MKAIKILLAVAISMLLVTGCSMPETGDVNADGIIDAADVELILEYIVGKVDFTPRQKRLADVNGDGVIDVGDAVLLLQIVEGK